MKKQSHIRARLLSFLFAYFLCTNLYAQINVHGTVSDEEDAPLIGATIIDTSNKVNGTITNIDGHFSLTVDKGDVLRISYVGFKDKKIKITNSTYYKIQLESSQRLIDEVVVVGYSTQKRVNLTGSVSSIDAKAFDKRPIISTSAALQGMAPGVTVTTQSGAPGADGGDIRIRGINSFGGSSTSPLVLIDGIEGSLNSVDPSLIKNISILKDAASSSIYGSRAANGVILVTTKRSSKEKFSLTYRGYVGWQSPTDLPSTVNAYQYRELTNQMNANDGTTPTYDEESMNLYQKNRGKDDDLYPDTDWQDAVLQGSGFTNSHTVSMGLGTERVRMLTTLGYTDQDGIIENSNYNRYIFRNNADIIFNDKLSMKLDISFSNSNRKSSPYQSMIFNYMNTRSADIPNQYTTGLYNGQGLQGNNPVALMREGGSYKTNTLRFSGSMILEYKPTEWLSIKGMIAPRYATVNKHDYNKTVTTSQDMEGTAQLTSSPYTKMLESGARTFYGNYNLFATFKKDFNQHNLSFILGSESNTYDYNYLSAYRQVFNYDYDQIDAGEIENMDTGGHRYEWSVLSYFARLNYNYKERYLLEANIRADGSSRFSKDNRWGYFPSVSAAWRISEENFMLGIKDVVNNAKIRASYGVLGNQNLSSGGASQYYPTTENLATGQISMNGNIYPIVTLNTLANKDIKWEKTSMFDIGLDISLLNKFNITADYYEKVTDDILMKLDMPLGVGLNAPYQNAGKVSNKGWELGIGYHDSWNEFQFDIQANISDVKNKITNMHGKTSTSGVLRNQEGSPIASIYTLESKGLIRTQEDADWINENCPQFGEIMHIGDIRYTDVDGNNTIDTNDKKIVGSTIPRYTYSLNTNFTYKGIHLGIMLQGVGKVDGYLSSYYVMPSYSGGTFRTEYLDAASDTNPNGSSPRLTSNNKNNWYNSSYWMKSASYLRLKNIQLGYDLPKTWLKKLNIHSALIYVNAQNLFTWTSFWDGYDPEIGYGGNSGGNFDVVSLGSANNYPQVKIVTVGVNLKF